MARQRDCLRDEAVDWHLAQWTDGFGDAMSGTVWWDCQLEPDELLVDHISGAIGVDMLIQL